MQSDIEISLEKWKDRNLIEYESISYEFNDWDNDEYFMRKFPAKLESIKPDILLSVNYMSLVSDICERYGIEYISWVYDSPMHSRRLETFNNNCNKIYMFDRGECEKLNKKGYKNIFHMPLAVDFERIKQDITNSKKDFSCDFSFIGKMYESDYVHVKKALQSVGNQNVNVLDEIVKNQVNTDKYIIGDSIDEEIMESISSDLLKTGFQNGRRVIKEEIEYAMATYTTNIKRKIILKNISEIDGYTLEIYTNNDTSYMPLAVNKGTANYRTESYKIFNQSKINLNITFDIIKTGMSLRIIDILGAGGFLLTNYQEELLEHLRDKEHIVIYNSMEEAIDLANYYIKNEAERKIVAESGYKRAKECFDMEKVLFRLIFG